MTPIAVVIPEDASFSSVQSNAIESPATQSASIREATPAQTDVESIFLHIDGTGGARVRALVDVPRTADLGDEATVVEAVLVVKKAAAWPLGDSIISARSIAADVDGRGWDASTVTWTEQPSTHADVTDVVVPGGGAVGDEIEIPVTVQLLASIAENDDEGAQWHGILLEASTAGDKLIFSALAEPDMRPVLRVIPAESLEPGENLQPAEGRSASSQLPFLTADVPGEDVDVFITGVQWQIDDADDFTAPTYDSGLVDHDEANFNLDDPPTGAPLPAELTAGVSHFHRMLYRDQHGRLAPWSETAEFTIVAKGTLVLSSPAIAGGEVSSPTPTTSFVFTPAGAETIRSVEVLVERRILEGPWEEHWRLPLHLTSETSFTLPDDHALEWGYEYRITVVGEDDQDRADIPGDRSFYEVTTEPFTLAAVA